MFYKAYKFAQIGFFYIISFANYGQDWIIYDEVLPHDDLLKFSSDIAFLSALETVSSISLAIMHAGNLLFFLKKRKRFSGYWIL